MKRRVIILFLGGLAFAGCAQRRSSIRDLQPGEPLPTTSASASELPPIRTPTEAGQPASDPSRPAVKTWARGDGSTTRGQSPDPSEEPTTETVIPPKPELALDTQSQPVTPGEPPPAGLSRASDLKSRVSPAQVLGITMASVGGEAITSSEVQWQFNEFIRENVPEGQRIPREDAEVLIHRTLEQIIDRTVVVQEAKRIFFKSDKQKKMFSEFCEKQWNENELPSLCRKNKVSNALELRKKLDEMGDSLDDRRMRFEREYMAREFLNMHLMSRLKPTLPEMRAYYAAHRSDFHRKAQITWREIFVPGQTPESRAKITALLDRLRRGASFETVAKSDSGGPTASKGGKWETGLGASISPAVNSALETLPLKQTSGILEGKKGYHIIRVEHRQAEGPAPFSVVQDKVYNVLFNENFQREMEAYVKKLRSETVITYWINGNAPAPSDGDRIPEPSRDPQAIRTSATVAP
jgi:hypothetical protein